MSFLNDFLDLKQNQAAEIDKRFPLKEFLRWVHAKLNDAAFKGEVPDAQAFMN